MDPCNEVIVESYYDEANYCWFDDVCCMYQDCCWYVYFCTDTNGWTCYWDDVCCGYSDCCVMDWCVTYEVVDYYDDAGACWTDSVCCDYQDCCPYIYFCYDAYGYTCYWDDVCCGYSDCCVMDNCAVSESYEDYYDEYNYCWFDDVCCTYQDCCSYVYFCYDAYGYTCYWDDVCCYYWDCCVLDYCY